MNHSHVLYDADPHFTIDPISRSILNNSSKKVRLIQYDHNSERFTFELPQNIEGHDMSKCNLVEIHYVNVGSNSQVVRGGVYTVDDLHIDQDDGELVVFSWLIPNHATQYVGQLNFLIRFSCVNESTGQVEYVWNTGIHTGITVSSGIYNSDSQSDNPVYPYNFVTTLDGSKLTFYVGSEEEYNKLQSSGLTIPNCLYITDDPTIDVVERNMREFEEKLAEFKDQTIGSFAKPAPRVYLVCGSGMCASSQVVFQFFWYSFNELTTIDEVLTEMSSAGALFGITPTSSSNGVGYPCSGLYKGHPITSLYKPNSTHLAFMLGGGDDTSVSDACRVYIADAKIEVKKIFDPALYNG